MSSSEKESKEKIEVTCPYEDCGKTFHLNPSLAGRKVRCDKCRRRFIVGDGPGVPSRPLDLDEDIPGKPTAVLTAADALEPIDDGAQDDTGGLALDQQKLPTPAALENNFAAGSSTAKGLDEEEESSAEAGFGLATTPVDASPAPAFGADFGEEPKEESSELDDMSLDVEEPAPSPAAPRPSAAAPAAAPARPAAPAGQAPAPPAPQACPQCNVPFSPGQQECSVCGYKPGMPADPGIALDFGSKIPWGQIVTAVVIVIAGFVGFRIWQTRQSSSPGGAQANGGKEESSDDVGKSVLTGKGMKVKFARVTQERLTVTEILAKDKVESGIRPRPIIVRRDQPVVLRKVKEGQALIEVRIPEKLILAWVPEHSLKLDSSIKKEELLGYDSMESAPHTGPITGIAFRNDGNYVASMAKERAGEAPKVNIWDTTRMFRLRTYEGHRAPVQDVAYLSDDTLISIGKGEKSGYRNWDPLTTGTLRYLPKLHPHLATFTADDVTYAVEIRPGQLNLWDVYMCSKAATAKAPATVSLVRVSDDAKFLLAVAAGGTIYRFSLPGLKPDGSFKVKSKIVDLDISSSGKTVLACSKGSTAVQLLDGKNGRVLKTIRTSTQPLSARFLGNPMSHIAVAFSSSKILIYSARKTEKPVKEFENSDVGELTVLAVSPDRTQLVSGHEDGNVRFWKLKLLGGKKGAESAISGDTIAKGYVKKLTVALRNNQERVAKEWVDRIFAEFPGTRYADQADRLLRNYKSNAVKKKQAAEREKKVKAEMAAKRLYSLFNSYLVNNKLGPARKYFQQLEKKFPDSPWTKKARGALAAKQ